MNYTRLSKTVAQALRHHPERFGLKLDVEGWTEVDALLAALRTRRPEWRDLSETDLAEMMARAEKRRYEMSGGKIRAFYGHSVTERIEKTPSVPPESLYHGTAPAALPAIRKDGLKPMNRQYVHLSTDAQTARQVGLRHADDPIILRILAADAHRAGVVFYLGNDDVWLADGIPPRFIEFPML